jgi:biopolymer transport protein TolR
MRRRQKKSLTNQVLTDIPLTPLIDTALTLLIIFIVAAPAIQNGVRIALPKGELYAGKTKEEVVIFVDKANTLIWEKKIVTLDQLKPLLKEKINRLKTKTIFIKADRLASYGVVLELFEQLRLIPGIEHVILPTEK